MRVSTVMVPGRLRVGSATDGPRAGAVIAGEMRVAVGGARDGAAAEQRGERIFERLRGTRAAERENERGRAGAQENRHDLSPFDQ